MSRLVVVSNRVADPADARARAGGLAVALQDALRVRGGIWFGWSGHVVADPPNKPSIVKAGQVVYATMDLSRSMYNAYYNGYANRALWPLFHYRLDLTAFSQQNSSGYLQVNRQFAEQLIPLLKRDDLIWVHDYHLIPLGDELRTRNVAQRMGFFLHTPFPAMEILTALPSHAKLVRAMTAYDVIGFQTANDLRAFLDYVVNEAGGEILGDHLVRAWGRTFRAEIFPIGIDTDDFARMSADAASGTRARRIRSSHGQMQWLIGVDRLDYSKGLVERFCAFERFLENHPQFRRKVSMIQIAPPSRSEVPEYKEIRRSLEAEAGHLNGRFADLEWTPLNYINRSFTRAELASYYRASRVGVVTPLRDGMNLVAKEYVASQDPNDPGVLVLSRFAGAARELKDALIVNPFDIDSVADAMARGLTMPVDERRQRWSAMMAPLRTNTLSAWRDSFLNVLADAPFGAPR